MAVGINNHIPRLAVLDLLYCGDFVKTLIYELTYYVHIFKINQFEHHSRVFHDK